MARSLCIATVALAACTPQPLQVSGQPSPHVPAVLSVSVELHDNGVVWVEYGDDMGRTPGQVEGPGTVVVPVVGLRAGSQVPWRVVVQDADGESSVSETQFFSVPEAPGPPLDVTVSDVSHSGGYVLTSSLHRDRPFVGIADREGNWVWWKETDLWRVPTTRLSHNGRSVMWGEWADDGTSDVGSRLFRVSLDGSTLEETWLPRGHHDFVDHRDGTVAFLSLGWRDEPARPFPVATDRIETLPSGSGPDVAPHTVFDTFTEDPVPEGPWCDHTKRANEKFGQQVFELTHGNSLAYVEEEDAYYVNAKFTDWMMKVDAVTGRALWQLSGPEGDFTLPDGSDVWRDHADSELFSHGHMSDVWPGGLLMFDNGDHRVDRVSRVVRIDYDADARTAEVVWSYDHPKGKYTPTMGDAKRLATGNVLTGWASLGEIREIRTGGRTVWAANNPGGAVGRVTWLPELVATARASNR